MEKIRKKIIPKCFSFRRKFCKNFIKKKQKLYETTVQSLFPSIPQLYFILFSKLAKENA